MTECTQPELRFRGPSGHEVVARFDGGDITSDAGSLLLRCADDRLRLLERFSKCFTDYRDPLRTEHTLEDLVRQRVFGLALGYEDLVDHDELRRDPLLASMIGKRDPKGVKRSASNKGHGLAGSRTLNRLELSTPEAAQADRYRRTSLDTDATDQLLVDIFLESCKRAPRKIVLDLDATDDPLHGKQEGRFFHGYYDCYCYLPLYIFSGEHLLCARLRKSDQDGAAGSCEELERIVSRVRSKWPKVQIIVRADSGFCRDWLMSWCEERNVDYVLGLARNSRLEERVGPLMEIAKECCELKDATVRLFIHFPWQTKDTWSRERLVIAKGEYSKKGPNPRFIVTSLPCEDPREARQLYDELYCARGDMENRIKEQQLYLFADRTSTHTMRGNQVRLYLSSMAYVLLAGIRRLALAGTEMAKAQCDTIRLRLLKIGARLRVSARRVWVHMASGYPWSEIFFHAWHRLRST